VAALDLSGLPEDRRHGALESAAAALQGSLDLGRCPLMRAVLFELGEGRQRLFLVLHHLIVDGVSWRILLGDLESAWRGLPLPPVPTSLRQWADLLAGQDFSPEAAYWLAPARSAVRPLPVDRTEGEDLVASSSSVVAELNEEETRALLEELPSVYHTRINDALLTALAQAFAGWTGEPRLLVDLEGHGREELLEGADPSRTVGWLTALFPVLLELDRKQTDPGEQLKAVKEQLRAVPRGGIGYGVLRYLGDPGIAARLRELPAAEVVFNYLGQLDRGLPESALLGPAPESGGSPRSPRQRRDHLLEINGGVTGGRLRLTWTYSENRHARATVEALAGRFTAALRALIERSRASGAGGFTPSDFAEARISQKDLDKLMSRIGKRGPGSSRGR
jgi:non-ribosomal peptide synthase protein (TIGR01720 family)